MENELGNLLRRARKARNYRLKDVANAVGKTQAYICDIEKGVRGTKGANQIMLMKWAEYLNLPIALVLTKAGHDFDEENERFKVLTKITRNKIKTARMMASFKTIFELLHELQRETSHNPPLRKLVKSLETAVKELDASLMYAN